jgi:septal ring-binding cell division protein DamX
MTVASQRYDHPQYLVRHETLMKDQSGASATDFAVFRTANKVIVTHCHIRIVSASSANERFYVVKAGPTIATMKTLTPATGGSAGSMPSSLPSRYTLTLASSNTLRSLGEYMALRHDNADGVYDVIWEWYIAP